MENRGQGVANQLTAGIASVVGMAAQTEDEDQTGREEERGGAADGDEDVTAEPLLHTLDELRGGAHSAGGGHPYVTNELRAIVKHCYYLLTSTEAAASIGHGLQLSASSCTPAESIDSFTKNGTEHLAGSLDLLACAYQGSREMALQERTHGFSTNAVIIKVDMSNLRWVVDLSTEQHTKQNGMKGRRSEDAWGMSTVLIPEIPAGSVSAVFMLDPTISEIKTQASRSAISSTRRRQPSTRNGF